MFNPGDFSYAYNVSNYVETFDYNLKLVPSNFSFFFDFCFISDDFKSTKTKKWLIMSNFHFCHNVFNSYEYFLSFIEIFSIMV